MAVDGVVDYPAAEGQHVVCAGNDGRARTGHGDMRRANDERSGAERSGDADTNLISADARAAPSRQTLRSRLRDHVAGNAFSSTLRLTLGCLLADRLGITLQQVGGGHV